VTAILGGLHRHPNLEKQRLPAAARAVKVDRLGPAAMPSARTSPGTSSRTSSGVLLVSAFAPELAPLVRWLESPAQRRLRPTVTCQPVGIGAVDAAAGAAAALVRHAPTAIVFVGTAGSYGARPPLDAVAVARALHLASGSAAAGGSYFPGPMLRRAGADAALRRALLAAGGGSAVEGDVATPLGITSSRRLAARLAAASGALVENLEAFAVARAAAAAEVPFGAVLGVANRVGPAAHEQWLRHRESATAAACALVAAWLEDRASG